ncbi:nitrogenase component 1 [Methanospirillum stamsii]|uniref:Nitrogenase/oxidoreductase component 1 domain-containing protein n=1 Tax=Methanospirillum stamsii TaxID=1277351 RepID=A0A2V2NG22_9EURY|nr:nitrogenase component 1 [Methanospirillum stamsii]PWR74551.1 hypothetical protein DLD82_08890 [Methanospirillum stamsii]
MEAEIISLDDILVSKESVHPPGLSPDCLHYCPPTSAGWGIVRVALLVPESAMLFVSPSGCARHAAIAGIHLGFWDRFFCYRLSETDIVSGAYMDNIPRVSEEILRRTGMKALIICSTCIDDLLGSDYDNLVAEIERKTGIPVRLCRMDPICMHTPNAPPLKVQETVYKFLQPSAKHDDSINILGNFASIDETSEFYEVLCQTKDREIRHITNYSSYEEFQVMATSSYNLLIKPAGILAAQDLKNRLNIPWISAYHSYGIERIDGMYHMFEKTFNESFELDDYRDEAIDTTKWFTDVHGESVSVAVGSTANAAPFELARTFVEIGIDVPYIFADAVQEWEKTHVQWLKKHNPSMKVFSSSHPKMADARDMQLHTDYAIGFDAGYYCPGAKTVPWGLEKQPFGYSGLISLLHEMDAVTDVPQDFKSMVYASGLVI